MKFPIEKYRRRLAWIGFIAVTVALSSAIPSYLENGASGPLLRTFPAIAKTISWIKRSPQPEQPIQRPDAPAPEARENRETRSPETEPASAGTTVRKQASDSNETDPGFYRIKTTGKRANSPAGQKEISIEQMGLPREVMEDLRRTDYKILKQQPPYTGNPYIGAAGSSAEKEAEGEDEKLKKKKRDTAGRSAEPAKKETKSIEFGPYSYRFKTFVPGRNERNEPIRTAWDFSNLETLIKGSPDWSYAPNVPADLKNRTLLTLGYGGYFILEIGEYAKNEEGEPQFVPGYITDEPGVDITAFENPFLIAKKTPPAYYIETAVLSVSEEENGPYTAFECVENPPRGCIGLRPPQLGGDTFDLSEIGIDKVRFIKVQDSGLNKGRAWSIGTEGADIDSVKLIAHPKSTEERRAL